MPKNPLTLFLVRHGADASELQKKFIDARLTTEGVEQSQTLAKYLKKYRITRILSSPMLRAKETAEIIAEELNLPYETDELLKDRYLGQAEGLNYAEVQRRFSKIVKGSRLHKDWRFPLGESNLSVYERAHEFAIKVDQNASGKIENIVVISHSLLLNYLTYNLQGIGFQEKLLYGFTPGTLAIMNRVGDYYQMLRFETIQPTSSSSVP